MLRNHAFALALILSAIGAQSAQANIFYTYQTSLSSISGPDSSGLNGATATLNFDVVTPGVYVDRFSYAAIPTINEKLTISGATVGANNGIFSLPALAFYPTLAGFFKEPSGLTLTLLLPDGFTLQLTGNTVATPGSSDAAIGSAVELDDFIPSGTVENWALSDGTKYSLKTIITATARGTTPVPEPATLSLLAAALLGGAALRRRRKSQAA